MTVDLDAKACAYGRFFETMTRENIEKIHPLVTEDMRFKDPFNDVRGLDRLLHILAKMFEDTNDITFTLREQAGDGPIYFLRWHVTCRPNSRFLGGSWQVDGISMITLNQEGLVKEHVDYRDAAEDFYDYLPVIGALLCLVRRPLVLKD